METTTIEGVEILRTGTYTGVSGGRQTYKREDLDEMAAAHAALDEAGQTSIRVTLGDGPSAIPLNRTTIGHNVVDKTGRMVGEAPVIGRLTNMRRRGDFLVADIADVPAKLAPILAKAYPQRSIEGVRMTVNKITVGAKTFRQAITGLALLGASLPAVSGLADLPLLGEAEAGGFEFDQVLAAAEVDPELALEEVLAALDAVAERAIPLVAGKTGAPIIRARVRSLKEDLRRIAGTRIQNSEADMSDETTEPVMHAGASDPATALAIIAEILGMPEADPTALVAKIREMAGGGSAAAGDTTEGTAMQQNASGAEGAEVQALRGQVSELLTWKAQQEGAAIVSQAEGLVDKAIASGKFAPAQRETLVALAKHDTESFVKLADGQPASIPVGERGTSIGAEAKYEPTAAEIDVAVKMGLSRDDAITLLRAEKAVEVGA